MKRRAPAAVEDESQAQPLPQRSIAAETAGLVALSLLSPALGLAVEVGLAWRFGTSVIADAYRVSALLILFGQQLFVTSILPFVIVPVLAEYKAQGKAGDAWASMDALAKLLLVLGSLIAASLFLGSGPATDLLAPGLTAEARSTAVFFVRWCSFAFVPLCWSGVACGILYAHGIFRVAPLSQAVSNLAVLLAIMILGHRLGATSIVVGVLLGTIGSASIYASNLARVRRQFAPRERARGTIFALRKLARLAAPLLAGIIVGQTSGAVVTRALSRLAVGNLAAFGYSWKLGQIVLLSPSALSTVLFPRLSASWHSEGPTEFTADVVRAIRAIFFVTMPLMCVSFALRGPIVTFLLQRGAFSSSAAQITAMLFGILILGAPGTAIAAYLDRMFYAMQETSTPVIVDTSCAFVAMVIVPTLAARFGVQGVAFVYMLLPWVTSGVLFVLFQHRHKDLRLPSKEFRGFFLRIGVCAVVSAWLSAMVASLCKGLIGVPWLSTTVTLLVGTTVAGVLFLASSSLLGLREAAQSRERICGAAQWVFLKRLACC